MWGCCVVPASKPGSSHDLELHNDFGSLQAYPEVLGMLPVPISAQLFKEALAKRGELWSRLRQAEMVLVELLETASCSIPGRRGLEA